MTKKEAGQYIQKHGLKIKYSNANNDPTKPVVLVIGPKHPRTKDVRWGWGKTFETAVECYKNGMESRKRK